jgi:NAD(P)-dependent dehydrogenase (short-subunit alcohol dehydrogenase family)
MAEIGANVVMACRSLERGTEAQREVQQRAGSGLVELMQVDLASMASIRNFAAAFKQGHSRLDVLLHNAANFDLTLKKPVLTVDGIESIFATNHVGVFLLSQHLLDVLKASAPSRIITVASKGLLVYPLLDIEFDNLNGERTFNPQRAYYHSKLAQVMYTYTLAERLAGTGVTVNCVRVGNVGLANDRLQHLPGFLKKLYALKKGLSITPEEMARTYVYLAADPALEEVTGGYWDENGRQVKSNAASYNRETWQKLWQATEELIS